MHRGGRMGEITGGDAMAAAPASADSQIPTIETGDHLSRAEFERRYAVAPNGVRAELIEGVAYVASPSRAADHGDQHGFLATWLGFFAASHGELRMNPETTVRLDMDNEPQPDVLLRRVPESGGSSSLVGGYIVGAPELVAEVSASSVSRDLFEKLNAYRRNGVQEYIVWRVKDGEIDWFSLEGGAYVRMPADERGVIHSKVFPGLRLTVAAMLAGDVAAVLAEQQRQ